MRTTDDDTIIRDQLADLGTISVPEKRVLIVFTCTALLWMFRRPLDLGPVVLPGWSGLAPEPAMIGDSTVAMTMALLLFVLPAGDEKRSRLLSWEAAVKLPWGVIVLLGGGFALAEAIRASGLAAWVGGQLTWVGAASPIISILVIALTISFMTEVTTNTAITTIMMPVLAAAAVAGGNDPLLLMLPCTLAASLCFPCVRHLPGRRTRLGARRLAADAINCIPWARASTSPMALPPAPTSRSTRVIWNVRSSSMRVT
jgi:sodium-dependent dicarboxylate transporter 2/3/5